MRFRNKKAKFLIRSHKELRIGGYADSLGAVELEALVKAPFVMEYIE